MIDRTPTWTLDEFAAEVSTALSSSDYAGAESGRVRDIPDARVIRYYTTLGLLDRPEMAGRTALYSPRHLAQLVAIKKLQARGLSLSSVQQELAGISDAGLARVAALTHREGLEKNVKRDPETSISLPKPEKKMRKESAFWAQKAPGETPRKEAADPAAHGRIPATEALSPRGVSGGVSGPMTGLKLGDHALLLIEALRLPENADLEAIAAAAEPLVEVLVKRGLIKTANAATDAEKGEK